MKEAKIPLKDKLEIVGMTLSPFLFIASIFLIDKYHVPERIRLYEQVSIIADRDRKNGTTHEEWARVYDEFGLHYDIHTSHPRRDLTKEQMRKYIDNYEEDHSGKGRL